MNDNHSMNIAFATDDNYVMPTVVAMTSLFENNHRPIEIHLLSITGHLAHKSKESLRSVADSYSQSIRFIDVDPEKLEGLPILCFGLSTYLRLFAPVLLPNVDRLLYMDADIVVDGDISELYDTDLDGCHGAGVADTINMRGDYLQTIGFNHDRPYINAGVLLMNLELLRGLDLREEIVKYMEHCAQITKYPDQDFINCAFPEIKIVHPKYNAIPIFWKDNGRMQKIWPLKQIAETIHKPVVVHFTSSRKPWMASCTHTYKARWRYYFQKTPCRDVEIDYAVGEIGRFIPHKLHLFVKICKDRYARFKYRRYL